MRLEELARASLVAASICTVALLAVGSCGGGDSLNTGTPTVASVAKKMVKCGYRGEEDLAAELELEFALVDYDVPGVVLPAAYAAAHEKEVQGYLKCLNAASCSDLTSLYCRGPVEQPDRSSALGDCFDDVRKNLAVRFTCGDGTKLRRERAECDSFKECDNDETPAACAATEHFVCDGRAVPSNWRCNGGRDCADGTDEQNCHFCNNEVTTPTEGCVPYLDCNDGSEQLRCAMFTCPVGTAIDDATAGPDLLQAERDGPRLRVRASREKELRGR